MHLGGATGCDDVGDLQEAVQQCCKDAVEVGGLKDLEHDHIEKPQQRRAISSEGSVNLAMVGELCKHFTGDQCHRWYLQLHEQ